VDIDSAWSAPLRALFSEHVHGVINIIGVGNPIRQDDGVGLHIASSLRRNLGSRPSPKVRIHPPNLDPERAMSKAASLGQKLLIFDAVEASGAPGTILSACLSDTRFGFFATHNLPLRLVPGVAANLGNSLVVGIQPESVGVGEGLSETVEAACATVISTVTTIIGGR
jgi:hydrogenase maturation protease